MSTSPLFTHPRADAVIAYRAGRAVRVPEFVADVRRVAAALPAGSHVLNVCSDRYRFTVAFAASLLRRKVSLLPSTHTPEVIRHLLQFAPDTFCIFDDPRTVIALPRILYPEQSDGEGSSGLSPGELGSAGDLRIENDQVAAYVFTSGSTGLPVPHRKSWGPLVSCVRLEAECLGLAGSEPHVIVGTVPPQHMYGFESSVLLALQSGSAFSAARPFYPADICAELARIPVPRVLVSTPVHLRALLAAGVSLPATALVLSATAPLPQTVACEVEQRFHTRLLEIYGSTETGQIASRRSAVASEWQLFRGVRLSSEEGRTWADGGHIEQRTPLCDVVEITGAGGFILHGRLSDLVNIAGKRSSIGYLDHQLQAIPGVRDAAFFMRDEQDAAGEVTRVAALVVAPGLDAPAILRQLRERIDPVFLPRPLLFVDALPRNETGKLPREALLALAVAAGKRTPSRKRR